MAAEDHSLFREIDDAVRHDRMLELWKQYRAPLLAAAIALVVGTAGAGIWRNYQDKQAGLNMQQLSRAQAAYQARKYDDATEKFAALSKNASTPEARDMALLWQARAELKAEKNDAAIATLTTLAEKPQGKDLLWRDLACLRLVGLKPEQNSCLRAGTSPLSTERNFIRAANLWQEGKADAAAKELKALSTDPDASSAQRERAAHYLSVVAADVQK